MKRFGAIIGKHRWIFAAAVVVDALALVGLFLMGIQPILLFMFVWSLVVTVRPNIAKSFWQSLREEPEYNAKWIVFIVSLFAIAAIWQVHTFFSSAEWIKQGPWSYLLVALTGLFATIFGVTVSDVLVKPFRRLLEGEEQEAFLDFFGRSCRQDGITLVFSKRVLDRDRLMQGLKAAGNRDNQSLPKSVEKFVNVFSDYPFIFPEGLPAGARQTQPEDVTSWVAYQDVQSGAHLAQLLARVRIQRQIIFELDADRAGKGWDISQVSFGLGYNVMTDLVQRQFDKKARGEEQILALPFEVDYTRDSPKKKQFKTDNIIWQGEFFPPPENHDYAIIVRFVHGNKDYVTFICAGRTACGTTAAGMYLAKHWKDELKSEYDKKKSQGEVIDGQTIDLHTHSLFVIVEHLTNDPHGAKIAKHPKGGSKRLIHFEVCSLKKE
ncbi:MAG: hypothetical protein ACHRXM_20045 [Isosphaerales bacterium]